MPKLQCIELPDDVNVAAEYGVVPLRPAQADAVAAPFDPAAERFVEALLGASGYAVLGQWGLAPR